MKKKITHLFPVMLAIAALFISAQLSAQTKKVLVFSKTAGFRHGSAIDAGKKSIMQLGVANKFQADTTENATAFTAENLKQYAAVVFLLFRLPT